MFFINLLKLKEFDKYVSYNNFYYEIERVCCKGMYNNVPSIVSEPSAGLEMVVPSPREATARARAPRLNHRLKQRCRSRLVESTTDVDPARTHAESSIRARWRMGCRNQRGRAPPRRGLRAATSAVSRATGCARRPPPCHHETHGPAPSHCGPRTGKLRSDRGEPVRR